MPTLIHGFERRDYHGPGRRAHRSEAVRPRWQVENTMLPSTEAPEGGFAAVHGRRVYLELVAPQLALGTASTVTVYAQTDAGRRAGRRGCAGGLPLRHHRPGNHRPERRRWASDSATATHGATVPAAADLSGRRRLELPATSRSSTASR